MDLTKGDVLIFSGEGENGNWERYYGARNEKAIRSRLSRERSGGDRWASIWIEEQGREDAGYPGAPVYVELDRSLELTTGNMRAVASEMIRENPAAQLAASKRGDSPASAANGAKGGRPRKARLLELSVTKDGKPRTLALRNGGGVQYELIVIYPDGQSIRARYQPTESASIPDLKYWAEKNDFEVVE